jgi:hypothetical protein
MGLSADEASFPLEFIGSAQSKYVDRSAATGSIISRTHISFSALLPDQPPKRICRVVPVVDTVRVVTVTVIFSNLVHRSSF